MYKTPFPNFSAQKLVVYIIQENYSFYNSYKLKTKLFVAFHCFFSISWFIVCRGSYYQLSTSKIYLFKWLIFIQNICYFTMIICVYDIFPDFSAQKFTGCIIHENYIIKCFSGHMPYHIQDRMNESECFMLLQRNIPLGYICL